MESNRRGARILAVGAEQARVARAALCAGLAAGLEPARGVVWLLPATLPSDWMRPHNDVHNCTEDQLLSMAEGHLSVGGAWLEAVDSPEAAAWREEWAEACVPLGGCGDPPPHAALLYDALVLLLRALARLLAASPHAAVDLHRADHARYILITKTRLYFRMDLQ